MCELQYLIDKNLVVCHWGMNHKGKTMHDLLNLTLQYVDLDYTFDFSEVLVENPSSSPHQTA